MYRPADPSREKMSEDTPIHVEYVTTEYAEKLDWYAESHDVSRELAETTFRGHCRELEGSFRVDTPGNVIRRIALQKLERAPPSGPVADGVEEGAEEGVETGTDATRSRRVGLSGRIRQ